MDVELIAVGTELLGGGRSDTNSLYLARRIQGLGLTVRARTVLPDEADTLADAVRAAARRAGLVVITGGLGPTRDDLTREALAQAADVGLRTDDDTLASIHQRHADRGREVPPGAERQARVPEGAELLANRVGTAPGIVLRIGKSLVAALPGVPREMEPMFDRQVLPRLRKMASPRGMAAGTFRVARLTESEVDERLDGLDDFGVSGLTLLSSPGAVEVEVRLEASSDREAEASLARVEEELTERFGDDLFGRNDDTLGSVVGALLAGGGHTLATAESCSGGMLARFVTDTPGSSEYFLGGVVAYSDRLKQSLLDVGEDDLTRYGAVSREVAAAMANGVRARTGATHALSVTGIAGPEGGSEDKPVGLVFLGVSGGGTTAVRRLVFPGDRKTVRRRSASAALDMLRRRLLGLELPGEED